MPIFTYVEEFTGKNWELDKEYALSPTKEISFVLFSGINESRRDIPGNASIPIIIEKSDVFKNARTHVPYKKTYGFLFIQEIKSIAATALLENNNKIVEATNILLELFPENSKGNHRIIYYSSEVG